MSLSRRRFLTITAAAGALGNVATARGAPARWRGIALGAEAEVTLYGMDPSALSALPALLADIENLFSLYDENSTLSRLNTRKSLARMPPRFAQLLTHCAAAHAATSGRFDPTVQPLWQAMARGGDLRRARAAIGFDRVRPVGGGLRIGADQALTLNGIAQGYATDLVTEHLTALGARDVLVNIGEYRAIDGPFRLGLSDPALGLHGWRTVRAAAMATSSPAALPFGPEQSHILDPLGLAPARWSSVTVEAETATLADAMSTAMCHMSAAEIRSCAKAQAAIKRVIVVDLGGEVSQIEA